MIGAFFVPILIIITGLVFPFLRTHDATAVWDLLNHWITRAFLFVVISLSFFHWAHRFRYIVFDLGVKGGRGAVAFLCYGGAIVGTLTAGAIALRLI